MEGCVKSGVLGFGLAWLVSQPVGAQVAPSPQMLADCAAVISLLETSDSQIEADQTLTDQGRYSGLSLRFANELQIWQGEKAAQVLIAERKAYWLNAANTIANSIELAKVLADCDNRITHSDATVIVGP